MVREGETWKAVGWAEALQLAGTRLAAARGKVALVTPHAPGSFQRLAAEWAAAIGGTYLVYEPFAHEAMREANRRTFGVGDVPNFDFASARMVVKRKGETRPAVVACTLLPYDQQFELGATLAEASVDVKLNHPHCAKFCVLGGGSCSKG